MPGPAAAQQAGAASPRIRITGAKTFEMLGVVRIDRRSVTGPGVESILESVVRVRSIGSTDLLTVPRPGERVVGHFAVTSGDTIGVAADAGGTVMVIPLAAVGKLEVSRGRRHSRGLATAVGIAAGFGGFMAGGWLGVALCGSLDCDIAPLTGFALGAVLGGFTGRRLGAERWEPTTPAALRAGFQAIRD